MLSGLLIVALGACRDDQDPGLEIPGQSDDHRPSSNTLPPCPDGGPDATTPDAGCLDDSGAVLRP